MNGKPSLGRRNVLKGIGTGVAGGSLLTGTAAAGYTPTGDILLENLDFNPNTYTVSGLPNSVTWAHNDSGGGFIHNVAVDHDDMRSRVKSNPLNHGDTYTVHFDTTTIAGTEYLVVSDTDQTAAVKFPGTSINLHVHCDLHSPEMEMESFTVNK